MIILIIPKHCQQVLPFDIHSNGTAFEIEKMKKIHTCLFWPSTKSFKDVSKVELSTTASDISICWNVNGKQNLVLLLALNLNLQKSD